MTSRNSGCARHLQESGGAEYPGVAGVGDPGTFAVATPDLKDPRINR